MTKVVDAIKLLEKKYGPLKNKMVVGHMKKQFINDVEVASKKTGTDPSEVSNSLEDLPMIIAFSYDQNEIPIHLAKKGFTLLKSPNTTGSSKMKDSITKMNEKEFNAIVKSLAMVKKSKSTNKTDKKIDLYKLFGIKP